MGKARNNVKHRRHTSPLSGEILLVWGLAFQLLPEESAHPWDWEVAVCGGTPWLPRL